MSKKKYCCCKETCCCDNNNGCCGSAFAGINSCVAPIIFLLIACGSGVLGNSKSYLIILLFLLVGGCYGSLFGDGNDCCESDCCC